MPVLVSYVVPDESRVADLLARLSQDRPISEVAAVATEHRFYDSFDWRLFRAGVSLVHETTADGGWLIWQDLAGRERPRRWAAMQPPGLASDLPNGPLRDLLAPVLGVRRLLPIVAIDRRSDRVQLPAGGEGVIVRARIDRDQVRDPSGGPSKALPVQITLEPLSGGATEIKGRLAALKRPFGLRRVRVPRLIEALSVIERTPGDYSSKLDIDLAGHWRAEQGLREILRYLLAVFDANIAGASAHLDPEFLHDLRVATRRARSLLSQIKDVLPASRVASLRERLAWLQQVTGPARDLDVYLLGLEGDLARLPAMLRPHLAPLETALSTRHRIAQQQVSEWLESAESLALSQEWRELAETPVSVHEAGARADWPLKLVADRAIWRRYRRVRDDGRAIDAATPAPVLHELRKDIKKLRYLMEFFRSLYGDQISTLIKQTKILLDDLGHYQDLAVQAQFLREAAHRMDQEGQCGADSLLAIGALVGALLERQSEARERFAASFASFDGRVNRSLFRDLFKPSG
ncbi:CHAD domain-containing protein [Thioalkalicoccus limnaeus]|uniref:CHAD domain-containing protein n=1 Tax=Thioalkalicoccus limnaeus TaxID=120681 RepID=A0ABV4BFF3_9GAMM